jgi:hypothetical protein
VNAHEVADPEQWLCHGRPSTRRTALLKPTKWLMSSPHVPLRDATCLALGRHGHRARTKRLGADTRRASLLEERQASANSGVLSTAGWTSAASQAGR